jgi:hypothetical protein
MYCKNKRQCIFLQPKGKDDDKKNEGEKVGSGRAIPIKQVNISHIFCTVQCISNWPKLCVSKWSIWASFIHLRMTHFIHIKMTHVCISKWPSLHLNMIHVCILKWPICASQNDPFVHLKMTHLCISKWPICASQWPMCASIWSMCASQNDSFVHLKMTYCTPQNDQPIYTSYIFSSV